MNNVEDPKMMLQGSLRQLTEKRSTLNDQVANLMATQKVQSQKVTEKKSEYERYVSKAKALKENGDMDKAQELAIIAIQTKKEMEEETTKLTTTTNNVQTLQGAVEVATSKIEETKDAIQKSIDQAEIAKVQSDVAKTMASFEADDSIYAINEMKNKLDLQSAKDSSKLDVALNGQKSTIAEMEADKIMAKSEAKIFLDSL